MNVFRMKSIAYVVVSLFVLMQICVLSSAIAECGIEDIDAAYSELDGLYKDQDEAERELEAAQRAYDNYVDTIVTQYLVGMGAPGLIGLLGGPVTAGFGALVGAILTTVKVSIEASNLMEEVRVARSTYESVSQQVRDLEDRIILFWLTHDDDDQEDNNQNNQNNDDGCNDS